MGTKELTKEEVARSFPSLQGLPAKTKMLSLSFSLLSSSGSLQSSSNAPHITLSSVSKSFLRSQRLDLKNYFSLVVLRQSTHN